MPEASQESRKARRQQRKDAEAEQDTTLRGSDGGSLGVPAVSGHLSSVCYYREYTIWLIKGMLLNNP